MLYELLNDKNIGVNSLRSSYCSYYLNKVNKNQVDRIAFIMRSSPHMLYTNYFKAVDDTPVKISPTTPPPPTPNKPIKIIQQVTPTPIKKLSDAERQEREKGRANYLHEYYFNKKDVLLKKAKENDKANYGTRYIRELNNNLIQFKNIRSSTIEKYGIKFNDKTNLYYLEK